MTMTPMIKPLVWVDAPDHWKSDIYLITSSYGQGPERFMLSRGSKIINWNDAVAPLQAAAQADHDARIIAALDPEWLAHIEALETQVKAVDVVFNPPAGQLDATMWFRMAEAEAMRTDAIRIERKAEQDVEALGLQISKLTKKLAAYRTAKEASHDD
jgi:hypothetical protein